jgi:hypothetical protein
MKIKGWNDFYKGWLARVLLKNGDGHHEAPVGKNDAWLLGWKTADESYGRGIGDVLLMEIDKEHVLVE